MTPADKYLRRYAEPEALALLENKVEYQWRNVLVIPAYAESPNFLERLPKRSKTLTIVVLNRPRKDRDPNCNDALRKHVQSRPSVRSIPAAHADLYKQPDDNHLLLIERPTALPDEQGVGLARKIGCDVALALHRKRCISGRWIYCSDADAQLPHDYFQPCVEDPKVAALIFAYRHESPEDARQRAAINVYERHMAHYVDGLNSAGSPYAFHTLGSCLAVDFEAYAKVRGFPRRSGGEDFYLLNKLAKIGKVITPECQAIRLSARVSERVPFGTGPALSRLLENESPIDAPIFYNPKCFSSLGSLISIMSTLGPGAALEDLSASLSAAPLLFSKIESLGIDGFLKHAQKHCKDEHSFQRQFADWFDAFRTLKLIHALSENWPRLSLHEIESR